jgi:hypothetical protein
MNKLAPLFLSLLMFASFHAHADIGETWTGWADWTFDGTSTRCPVAKFQFTESATELSRVSGGIDCDAVVMDYPALKMEKRGQELWSDNQKVGSFDEHGYTWTETYSDTVHIDVSAKRDAGHLDYQERWINASGDLIYDIKARLFTSEH